MVADCAHVQDGGGAALGELGRTDADGGEQRGRSVGRLQRPGKLPEPGQRAAVFTRAAQHSLAQVKVDLRAGQHDPPGGVDDALGRPPPAVFLDAPFSCESGRQAVHRLIHQGRLLDFLIEIGHFDRTLVVLLSDNGAAPEGGPEAAVEMIHWFNRIPNDLQENLARLDEIGGPRSYGNHPLGWALASNTPLRWYKHNTHGGGVRDPLTVHWPALIRDGGAIRE